MGCQRSTAWPSGPSKSPSNNANDIAHGRTVRKRQGAPRTSAEAPIRQEEAGQMTGSRQAIRIGRHVTRRVKKYASRRKTRLTIIMFVESPNVLYSIQLQRVPRIPKTQSKSQRARELKCRNRKKTNGYVQSRATEAGLRRALQRVVSMNRKPVGGGVHRI